MPFYFFRGINEGIPKNNIYEDDYNPRRGNYNGKGCVDEMKEFIGWFKNILIIVSFGAALFMFLNILLSCCMCCYSKKKRNMDSFVEA